LNRLATAAALGLIGTSALILTAWARDPGSVGSSARVVSPTKPSDLELRQAVTVLLRDRRGEQIGSGVIVGEAPGGYWIASNRHVLGDQKIACVIAGDRELFAAAVLPAPTNSQQADEDLALLWMPILKTAPRPVADLTGPTQTPDQLPIVVATGFPTPLKPSPNGPDYTELPGLLLPLLKQPLQGGFGLAYTSLVEKGMSGGGVFQGRTLIGINGAHANPLWPGQWKDQRNKPVSDGLNKKLELVSLGIPLQTILERLKSAAIPKEISLPAKSSCHWRGQVPSAHQAF